MCRLYLYAECLYHDCQSKHCPEQLVPCRANQVDVNVAVFTNILKDKVDEFGGIEAYLNAQESLFSKINDKDTQCLVVNIDGGSVALFWASWRLCACAIYFARHHAPHIPSTVYHVGFSHLAQHFKPWHRQVWVWHLPCTLRLSMVSLATQSN